jgi:hypothetical protein
MCKSESVVGLSMETVDKDGNCLFQTFLPFIAFQIIQNNVQLQSNNKKEE